MTPPTPEPAAPLVEDETTWAALAHLGGAFIIVAALLGVAGVGGAVQALVALLSLLPALVIWIVFGRRSARIATESKEALNFSLTAVALLVAWIIVSTVAVYLIGNAIISAWLNDMDTFLDPAADPTATIEALRFWFGVPTMVIAGAATLLSLFAGIRVATGHAFRYPVAVRLLH